MSKTRLAVVTALAGLITLFSTSAAQAYPDPTFSVTGGSAADGEVSPGEAFTLSGNFGGTSCTTWTFQFEGQSKNGSGNTWSVSFTAPTPTGTYTITAICVYDDGTQSDALGAQTSEQVTPAVYVPESSRALPTIRQTARFSFPVKVVAAGGGGNGDDTSKDTNGPLPNTGGPAGAILLVGGALVLVGGGVGFAARRRGTLS